MIKYLGSKRTLIPAIVAAVVGGSGAEGGSEGSACGGAVRSVLDLFSGTSRVGMALKGAGVRVIACDHNAYAATLARCYVQADREDVRHDAEMLVREFNALAARTAVGVGDAGGAATEVVASGAGYFTRTFCERSRYVQPKNGVRVDAIREAIAARGFSPELEAVLLVALMEAADRVDSTTGVQMAYLKDWSARSHRDLELRVPELLPRAGCGKGEAHELDAFEAAARFEADAAYIDPPYNQHSYLGNYHVWESLVRWDKPEVYGVACKRVDVRERRSVFNSRREFEGAMRRLLGLVRARRVVVSFSDEGFMARGAFEAMLGEVFGVGRGAATMRVSDHGGRRYVGAQIGIYNPSGVKVGRVGHLRNTEVLYVIERVGAAGATGRGEGAVAALV